MSIPTNQNTFTDADILAFADEEMALCILPAIMSLHEDYLLFSQDILMEDGISEYEIPYRAVGNKLYDLQFVNSDGSVQYMTRSTLAEQPSFNGTYTINSAYAYYVKNNRVGMLPTLGGATTGSLRFVYYMRSSSLVKTTAIAIITSIDRVTGEILVNSIPRFQEQPTFSTNTRLDFYKVKSPHNILAIDVLPGTLNTTTNSITFTPADIPDELEVGDHVALAQECAIPQIPSDLHVFLAQKTAERVLEAQGDSEGLQLAKQKSAEMEVRAGTIIDNRVDESPPKLVNRHGILRSGLVSRLYRRRG